MASQANITEGEETSITTQVHRDDENGRNIRNTGTVAGFQDAYRYQNIAISGVAELHIGDVINYNAPLFGTLAAVARPDDVMEAAGVTFDKKVHFQARRWVSED
jgi:hypothetical protein